MLRPSLDAAPWYWLRRPPSSSARRAEPRGRRPGDPARRSLGLHLREAPPPAPIDNALYARSLYSITRANLLAALQAEKAAVRRDRAVSVRVSPVEYQLLFAVARREGIATSTLARVLLMAGLEELDGEVKPGSGALPVG